MLVDCFPICFDYELDLLEIRLYELGGVVDRWVIVEAGETFGGQARNYLLTQEVLEGRFAEFASHIDVIQLMKLFPECVDRKSGRAREAYQRNVMMEWLGRSCMNYDSVIFSDLDELPRVSAVIEWLNGDREPSRFKCDSFYYNVNTKVDYGHDWAARPRIAFWKDVVKCESMYQFRMKKDVKEIENGGWHFGYFGGPQAIKEKVAALSPFLEEYRLFGDDELLHDIEAGRDLHRRRCELPEVFEKLSENQDLPRHLIQNREKFSHFFERNV